MSDFMETTIVILAFVGCLCLEFYGLMKVCSTYKDMTYTTYETVNSDGKSYTTYEVWEHIYDN
jgi:hypothetical protein